MKHLILLCIFHLVLSTLAYGQGLAGLSRDFESRLEYVGVAVEEPNYHVWGSSPVIGPGGKTHLFVSRWPVKTWFWWLDDSLRDCSLRWGPP